MTELSDAEKQQNTVEQSDRTQSEHAMKLDQLFKANEMLSYRMMEIEKRLSKIERDSLPSHLKRDDFHIRFMKIGEQSWNSIITTTDYNYALAVANRKLEDLNTAAVEISMSTSDPMVSQIVYLKRKV